MFIVFCESLFKKIHSKASFYWEKNLDQNNYSSSNGGESFKNFHRDGIIGSSIMHFHNHSAAMWMISAISHLSHKMASLNLYVLPSLSGRTTSDYCSYRLKLSEMNNIWKGIVWAWCQEAMLLNHYICIRTRLYMEIYFWWWCDKWLLIAHCQR